MSPRLKKKRPMRRKRTFIFRKRPCIFCGEKAKEIDYKDTLKLNRFISERGKMTPRRLTGTCAKHQRKLAQALKRARFIALLPYVAK
jgi:small subunit ribosomal protein S18